MTLENLKKHLKEYQEKGNKEAAADILKKYPQLAQPEQKAKK